MLPESSRPLHCTCVHRLCKPEHITIPLVDAASHPAIPRWLVLVFRASRGYTPTLQLQQRQMSYVLRHHSDVHGGLLLES